MKVDRFSKRLSGLVLAGAFACTAGQGLAQTEGNGFDRAGTFNVYAFGQMLWGEDIRQAGGPGFGVGYSFCDQMSLNLEGYVGDLSGNVNGVQGRGTTYTATLNVEYKLCTGRFSPYLTAGGGIFNWDIKDRDPNPILLNASATGAMYGGGAGVNYDISKHWYLKAAYRVFGTTVDGIGVLHGPTLAIGFNF